MKKEKTDMVEEKEKALAVDYGAYAGEGIDELTTDDIAVPFIGLLQSLSPAIKNDEIEGAKEGMFYNSVTKELIGDVENGFVFQPVYKDHMFIEWKTRAEGGDFVTTHLPHDDTVVEALKINDRYSEIILPNGNKLVDTHYIYGQILDESGEEVIDFGVISFTSTKIKPMRNWMTSLHMIKSKPPLFACRARFKSIKQHKGADDFYNYKIEPFNKSWADSLIPCPHPLLESGKERREQIKSGTAKAKQEANDQDSFEDQVSF